jgi:hypothetical protein
MRSRFGIRPASDANPECRSECTKDSSWVKPGFVHAFGQCEGKAAQKLGSGGHAQDDLAVFKLMDFGSGKKSRHNDDTRMDRTAFKSVIEVFAM